MALIHRWPLTVNANDVVGSLNLTNNGGVTFGADGASFNGTNQWLSGTIAKASVGFRCCWVKPSAWGEKYPFGNCNATSDDFWGCVFSGATSVLTAANYGPSSPVTVTGGAFNSTTFPNSSHKFIATGWDGTTLSLWDGTTKYTVAISSSPTDSNFSIGRLGAYSGKPFTGYIEDFQEYDYVPVDSFISALAAAGPNPSAVPRLCQAIGGF